jgi:hypothetical protein
LIHQRHHQPLKRYKWNKRSKIPRPRTKHLSYLDESNGSPCTWHPCPALCMSMTRRSS